MKINTSLNTNTSINERRSALLKIIKDQKEHGMSATIADLKKVFLSCSEKTLQRELVAMVKDGILKKTGDKRWSRYELL